MAGRSRHESITIYIGALQRATSCVTPRVYTTPGAYQSRSGLVDVLLGSGEPVRLRGPGRIHLRVRLRARVTQADPPRGLWDAETAAYEYRLSDHDDREILAYHWHPEALSVDAAPGSAACGTVGAGFQETIRPGNYPNLLRPSVPIASSYGTGQVGVGTSGIPLDADGAGSLLCLERSGLPGTTRAFRRSSCGVGYHALAPELVRQ